MNEQASKVLADLLEKASNGIDSAVAFSQAQLPDVISQLLIWNFTQSLVSSILGILLFCFFQYVAWRLFKYCKKTWAANGDDIFDHPEIFIYATGYLLSFIALTWVNLTWLKIWLSPKLYLIEYAASLIK